MKISLPRYVIILSLLTLGFQNCAGSSSPLSVPSTDGSVTPDGSGFPNLSGTPTCTLSVSNNGTVYNGLAEGYNPGITLSRSGTAVGTFSWTVNGAGNSTDPLLNNSYSSDVFFYATSTPVPAGSYSVVGTVQTGSTVVQCGTVNVNVMAPPSGAGAPASSSLPNPVITSASASGCGSVTLTGQNFPNANFAEVTIRSADSNWTILASTTIVSGASANGLTIAVPQSLKDTFSGAGLRFTIVNTAKSTSWDTSQVITCH